MAKIMTIQSIGCASHILALSPKHQLFKSKKQHQGQSSDEIPANAIPEIVEHHDRLRTKVVKFKYNEQASIALAKEIRNLSECPNLKPILDSPAKWSSTVEMDERDWLLRKAYASVAREPKYIEYSSCDSDYLMSRNCAGILRPFQHASNLLQKGDEPVSIVLPVFAALRKQLEPSAGIEVCGETPGTTEVISEGQLDEHSRNFRAQLRLEVDRNWKLFEHFLSVLKIAAAVDPRYRALAFLDSDDITETRKMLRETVLRYATEHRAALTSHQANSDTTNQGSRKRSLVGMESFFNAMNKIRDIPEVPDQADDHQPHPDQNNQLKRACKAEVNSWFTKDQIDISSDPFDWWKQNHAAWPCIAPIARKFLAIPSSNAGIERLFSSCRELLEFNRQSFHKFVYERGKSWHV